jgi:hypothetical protein
MATTDFCDSYMNISSREAGSENELQRNVEAFPHFETNYLKNTFVQNLKSKPPKNASIITHAMKHSNYSTTLGRELVIIHSNSLPAQR